MKHALARQSLEGITFTAPWESPTRVTSSVGWYYMRNRDYPLASVLLGLMLGPMLEQSLRQSLVISNGDPQILLEHPISATFLALTFLSLIGPALIAQVTRNGILASEEES